MYDTNDIPNLKEKGFRLAEWGWSQGVWENFQKEY